MYNLEPKPVKRPVRILKEILRAIKWLFIIMGVFFALIIVRGIFVVEPERRAEEAATATQEAAAARIILVPTYTPTPGEPTATVAPPTATPAPPTATVTPVPTRRPTATRTPVPPAPSFEEIRSMMMQMTDVQWKQYAPQQKGKVVVSWTGWVEEVQSVSGGGYNVLVDMDSPQELFSLYDVAFITRDSTAFQLIKDSQITFSGTIENAYKVLGTLQVDIAGVVIEQ